MPTGGYEAAEAKVDGVWVVRKVTGSAATKAYRCPGCDQLIPRVTPHVVAWPRDPSLLGRLSGEAHEERRHWHTSCWQRRP